MGFISSWRSGRGAGDSESARSPDRLWIPDGSFEGRRGSAPGWKRFFDFSRVEIFVFLNQSIPNPPNGFVLRSLREIQVQDNASIIVQSYFGFFDSGQFKISDSGSQRVPFFLQNFFLDRLIALSDRIVAFHDRDLFGS